MTETIKLQLLVYIKDKTDNMHLVTYPQICNHLTNTTDAYISILLVRLTKEGLLFRKGSYHNYNYGITVKGLQFLKNYQNEREVFRLTSILKQLAGLTQ